MPQVDGCKVEKKRLLERNANAAIDQGDLLAPPIDLQGVKFKCQSLLLFKCAGQGPRGSSLHFLGLQGDECDEKQTEDCCAYAHQPFE